MRGMTGLAIPLLDRLMGQGALDDLALGGSILPLLFLGQSFLIAHSVRMALPAENFLVSDHQFLVS